MGHQQLLLIMLGVIIVGIAVVLGIHHFSTEAEESAKDELVAYSMTIGANAQQWYKKPISMGGGGNSFAGFTIHYNNHLGNLHNSMNGIYSSGSESSTEVTIVGTPVASLNYTWEVNTRVTADGFETIISN